MADTLEASGSQKVMIVVGATPYSIDLLKIPYFRSYIDFRSNSDLQPVHNTIPYFDTVFVGIEKGYRHCFRGLPMDLEACHGVCETLDFLCVDVLGKNALDDIIESLKEGKGRHEVEYKYSIYVKGNKTAARDAAFIFVYKMLQGNFENEQKDSMKVFNAVKYVLSHRATFKYTTRMIVRAAYEERFHVSGKQIAELNRWPILVAGKDGSMEEEDVTTEESSPDSFDEDY